ncbi:hypothetical protein BH09MYX1_BH09MYX1_02880 [soil metagenome]
MVNEGYDTTWYSRMPTVDPWDLFRTQLASVSVRGGGAAASALAAKSGYRFISPVLGVNGFRLVRTIFADDDARPNLPVAVISDGLG